MFYFLLMGKSILALAVPGLIRKALQIYAIFHSPATIRPFLKMIFHQKKEKMQIFLREKFPHFAISPLKL